VANRPPFDLVKASFYLVAGVIGVHCAVVLTMVAFCWANSDPTQPGRCADLRGQLAELLTAALASALAFSAGRSRKDE
jgi:hypothetical protein